MIDVGVDDMNNTKQETISIIALAQKCYESYNRAFIYMKNGKEKKSQLYFQQGDELLLKVSRIHTKMLSEHMEMNLLLIHAEDLLISVQLYKYMIREFGDLYKRFPALKGN